MMMGVGNYSEESAGGERGVLRAAGEGASHGHVVAGHAAGDGAAAHHFVCAGRHFRRGHK